MTSRLRWRAIARALGVPRRWIRRDARMARVLHRRHGNDPEQVRWTEALLRDWASDWRREG